MRLHLNPVFGRQYLHRITTGDLQRFVSETITKGKLSPKSVSNILVLLKEIFKHAVAWGCLRRDPSLYVKRPRVEQIEMDFLNPQEIRVFLDNVRPQYYALFLTAVLTGMRRGELLALQWRDIDWRSSLISVRRSLYRGEFVSPKSRNSVRRIVMSPILVRTLCNHRVSGESPGSLVFNNGKGLPLDPENLIKREFHSALDRAGLRRIRFHDLRHTYASLLISQGENVKFIQSQLGHASAKTTLDRYGHLMPDVENNAARRLDQTVFGALVRKPLENPAEEGPPAYRSASEVIELQRLNLVAGGGFEPPTFGL